MFADVLGYYINKINVNRIFYTKRRKYVQFTLKGGQQHELMHRERPLTGGYVPSGRISGTCLTYGGQCGALNQKSWQFARTPRSNGSTLSGTPCMYGTRSVWLSC